MKKKRNLILSVFIGLNAFAWAQPAQRTFLPPTMGWSSWNTFALNISDKIIEGQADATHFFSTAEVVDAIREIDPSAKVAPTL